LRQTNNNIIWLLDNTAVAQRTNSAVWRSSNIMLAYMDPFPSIANPPQNAFGLFDNVRVEDLSAPALQAPYITLQPASQSVPAGASANFTVGTGGSPSLGYQWRLDGTNLIGATSSMLTVTNVQVQNIGSYDVVVTNTAGIATSAPAALGMVSSSFRFTSAAVLTNGQAQLLFSGASGQQYDVEASTNFLFWQVIGVVTGGAGAVTFTDTNATNLQWRFYRARQPQ